MIKFLVNLYKSIYWTKRAFVVFGIVIFACSGIRIFQFVGRKFTETRNVGNTELKAELGFGKISKLTLNPITTEGFKPTTFRNLTSKGNLDVENNPINPYPKEDTKTPTANVYSIIEKPISLQTAEAPRTIARNLSFAGEPTSSSSTVQIWKSGNKKLEVNGQFLTVNYENNDLRQSTSKELTPLTLDIQNSDSIRIFYQKMLTDLGITSNIIDYKFEGEYVNYDTKQNKYVVQQNATGSNFIRLNAIRNYKSLSKSTKEPIAVDAVYPNYTYSNNHIIIPTKVSEGYKPADILVRLSLYNWEISQDSSKQSKLVQTYNIKTPKKAYDELLKENKYLISVTDWNNKKADVDPSILSGANIVLIKRIHLQMYEDVINTSHIQPVYVFICEVEKNNRRYQLVYYVPAVLDVIE